MSFLSYFYVTKPVLGWQNQNNLIISQLFVDQKFVVLFLKMLQVSRESFWTVADLTIQNVQRVSLFFVYWIELDNDVVGTMYVGKI